MCDGVGHWNGFVRVHVNRKLPTVCWNKMITQNNACAVGGKASILNAQLFQTNQLQSELISFHTQPRKEWAANSWASDLSLRFLSWATNQVKNADVRIFSAHVVRLTFHRSVLRKSHFIDSKVLNQQTFSKRITRSSSPFTSHNMNTTLQMNTFSFVWMPGVQLNKGLCNGKNRA